MILVVCRIAILAASGVVPRDFRANWRRAWDAQIRHYATLLRSRGVKNRYVQARIWHHFGGAMLDAWRILSDAAVMRYLRLAIRKPGFCLGLIGLALAAIVMGSHGLAVTRAMLAPRYPDAGRLVLISQGGVLLSGRHAVPSPLVDFWNAHNTTLTGLAGYQWRSPDTAMVTPGFFDVLGARPHSFLLRRVKDWTPVADAQDVGVLGRLKPGVTVEAAQNELRDLAERYTDEHASPTDQVQVMGLVPRIRQPLYTYSIVFFLTIAVMLTAAAVGIRADRLRIGRIRGRYWAYFCAKSVLLPMALTLVIWEFTRATSFTLTGGATFVAEPFFIWLIILASGAIVWWCLADQQTRCRACAQTLRLQYPVRIGSLGAVLFDHAGTELVCCEGHGVLYVPATSSDYVQRGGWTTMDIAGLK